MSDFSGGSVRALFCLFFFFFVFYYFFIIPVLELQQLQKERLQLFQRKYKLS